MRARWPLSGCLCIHTCFLMPSALHFWMNIKRAASFEFKVQDHLQDVTWHYHLPEQNQAERIGLIPSKSPISLSSKHLIKVFWPTSVQYVCPLGCLLPGLFNRTGEVSNVLIINSFFVNCDWGDAILGSWVWTWWSRQSSWRSGVAACLIQPIGLYVTGRGHIDTFFFLPCYEDGGLIKLLKNVLFNL